MKIRLVEVFCALEISRMEADGMPPGDELVDGKLAIGAAAAAARVIHIVVTVNIDVHFLLLTLAAASNNSGSPPKSLREMEQ